MFRYNSYHKVVGGVAVLLWAIFHFSANDDARDDDEEDLNDLGLDSLKSDDNGP